MTKFFDRLEDRVRGWLSHYPIFYGIIGGIFAVLFWRGVWHTADIMEGWGGWWAVIFSGPGILIVSTIVLLATGLFVSSFIGNHIIISGLKKEKKLIDKTESELETEILGETAEFSEFRSDLREIRQKLDNISKNIK